MKILLDPGHYKGYNKGAVSGYAEGTAMYEYAQILKKLLIEKGADVKITRQSVEDNPSLTERGSMAKGYDFFISLHSNGASSPSANGVTVFYSIKQNENKAMAENWSKELAALICGGTRNRGAATRKGSGNWDYYTVIQSAVAAKCPKVLLVEHGFHSNPKECSWLMNNQNMEKMAELECEMIVDALGGAVPLTGWQKNEDGRWRFYNTEGKLLYSQWLKDGNFWYYLMADGTMAVGWAKIGMKWYYLNPNSPNQGSMMEGWLENDGKTYYLKPGDGYMITGTVEIDGKHYTFDSSGALIKEG